MKEIILQKSNFRCSENIYIMSTAKASAAPSGLICEKIRLSALVQCVKNGMFILMFSWTCIQQKIRLCALCIIMISELILLMIDPQS